MRYLPSPIAFSKPLLILVQDITNATCDSYKISGDNKSVEAMISDIALIR